MYYFIALIPSQLVWEPSSIWIRELLVLQIYSSDLEIFSIQSLSHMSVFCVLFAHVCPVLVILGLCSPYAQFCCLCFFLCVVLGSVRSFCNTVLGVLWVVVLVCPFWSEEERSSVISSWWTQQFLGRSFCSGLRTRCFTAQFHNVLLRALLFILVRERIVLGPRWFAIWFKISGCTLCFVLIQLGCFLILVRRGNWRAQFSDDAFPISDCIF